ncbi:hypothetical protein EJ04DRAFT_452167, partial [Polyplosphaeria fusca]
CLGPKDATQGKVGGAVNCAKSIRALGKNVCFAEGPNTHLCESGATKVIGWTTNNKRTTSWCEDVASGVEWILNNCPACGGNDCNIAGTSLSLVKSFSVYEDG